MSEIRTEQLTRVYAPGRGLAVRALDSVDLEIATGSFTAILGTSGSGKSTLLNLVGGLDRPTSGRLLVGGVDLAGLDGRARAAYRAEQVGFVFQAFHLQPRFPAWENVALPLVFSGIDRRTRRSRAHALLERVGLGARADHQPSELSGGEQQRVAVARSLVAEPTLLLCDEPTGNLDTATSTDILALLQEARADGTTIVMVTHDRALAAEHAERLVEMQDGRIVSDEAAP